MPALLAAALGSLIRSGLMVLAGYLVKQGIWSSSAAEDYVGAAVIFLLAFGWSIWQHYKTRIKFLTALDLPPGATEAHVETLIAEDKGAKLS